MESPAGECRAVRGMSFAEICDSGMVFIPCRGGVSHNPSEHAEITSICDGARVMYEYLKGETAK